MSAYNRIARNIEAGGDRARTIMLGLGKLGDGFTAMAVFCAAEGYTREAAATAVGCSPSDLDNALEALTTGITAERRRREQERTA